MNNLSTHQFKNQLYYVTSSTDETVLLAIDPIMDNDTITWFDTNKERIKPILKIIDDSEEKFCFVTHDGLETSDQYVFTPLTVDLYEQHVKQHLKDPHPYQNERHLFDLLLAAKRSAW